MRVFPVVGAAVLWMIAIPAPAGAQAARSGRTVQVISMFAAPARTAKEAPAGLAEPASIDAAPVRSPDAPLSSEAFRVHDLSRGWAAYHLANSLRVQPAVAGVGSGATAGAGEDPFAAMGVAQPGVPAFGVSVTVAPMSAISIPSWMRGGRVVAAAADSYVPGCVPANYRPSGLLRSEDELRRRNYFTMMSSIACQYGIPIGLFDAMIIRESRYDASIVSRKNAFGLTQLMAGTAAGLGVNRYDVEQNLRGGARYLRQQLDKFGQYHLALAAYNAGPGRVKDGRVPRIVETQDYVSNILANWSRLVGVPRRTTIQPREVAVGVPPTVSRTALVSSF